MIKTIFFIKFNYLFITLGTNILKISINIILNSNECIDFIIICVCIVYTVYSITSLKNGFILNYDDGFG